MAYAPETHDTIALDLTGARYTPGTWDSIDLEFVQGEYYPPVPWVTPKIVLEITAMLGTAQRSDSSVMSPQQAAIAADVERGSPYDIAGHTANQDELRHKDANKSDDERITLWGEGRSDQVERFTRWQQSSPGDNPHPAAWNNATALIREPFGVPFLVNAIKTDALRSQSWFTVHLTGRVYDDKASRERLQNIDPDAMSLTLATFGTEYSPQAWDGIALNFGWVKPKRPIVPNDKDTRLTARQATPRDSNWRIPWGAGSSQWNNWNLPYPVEDNEQPEPEPTDPPVIREVYLVMNTLDIRDIDTNTPLDITNVTISLDIDSFAWKFSGNLFGPESLNLVMPDSQGMKEISVIINSHSWVFAIESYSSDERFPTQKFKLSGISRTQYMAAPFAPTKTETNTVATTAAQAVETTLLNTGFAVNWTKGGDDDLPDWQIPAGAFRYQGKTPAQIIAQIVTAAGGVMIPRRDNDSWRIQPRYKVPPWQWDSATPDKQVYAGMIRSRAAKYEPGHEHNACFVSGIEQGVSVDVQRAGSGGTDPMPDIYDDLITEPQPAISRGRNELAATGNKIIETLSVFIPESGAAPGVIEPGELLKVLHDNNAKDYIGLVLSTNISVSRAGGAAVYQNVTIERNP